MMNIVVSSIVNAQSNSNSIIIVEKNGPNMAEDSQNQKHTRVDRNEKDWEASCEVSGHNNLKRIRCIPREAGGRPTGVVIRMTVRIEPRSVPEPMAPIERCITHNKK